VGIALALWVWCVNNGEFGFGLTILEVGWMADNVRTIHGSGQCLILKLYQMWIQAIAIILPRVQRHYDSASVPASPLTIIHTVVLLVSDSLIGILSSSMFAGMMIGAVGWGTCLFPCCRHRWLD